MLSIAGDSQARALSVNQVANAAYACQICSLKSGKREKLKLSRTECVGKSFKDEKSFVQARRRVQSSHVKLQQIQLRSSMCRVIDESLSRKSFKFRLNLCEKKSWEFHS